MSKIIVLENIRAIIKADKACKAEGLTVDMIPVPEHISSECGMCFVVEDAHVNSFRILMERLNLKMIFHEKR